jgi:histidinol-phosphate aminotransferase
MIMGVIRDCIKDIEPYVPGKPIEEVQRELGIDDVIKLASNENPLGPSQAVQEAVGRVLNRMSFYPDANAYYLREALANHLGMPMESIMVGNGSDDVNKVLGETILNLGDEVIIPQPTFSQYEYITLLMNASPVLIKGKQGLGNDLEAMRAALTPRTKLIYVCNPNNPTGTIVKKAELNSFLESLPREAMVVIDEAYNEFVDDPDYPDGLEFIKAGFSNVVVYRTFSKIHGIAGIRLGYCIGDPELINEMMRVKEPFNVSLLAQTAGVAALGSQEHVRQSQRLVWTEKRKFYRELDRLGVKYLPTQANFILINCGLDSGEIYRYLMSQGVIVRATHSFGLPDWIRVSFGTAEQNNRFLKLFGAALQMYA